jgi:hypothetical protein
MACAGPAEEEAVVVDPAVAPATPPAMGTTDVDTMVHSQQMVPLSPLRGSGVSGEAMFASSGQGTQVTLRVMGAPGAGTHASHVHRGTCEQQGPVVAPVGDVTVDATGTGSVDATLDLPMNTVMNGQHYIQAHESGSPSPGQPVTCGNIPVHTM